MHDCLITIGKISTNALTDPLTWLGGYFYGVDYLPSRPRACILCFMDCCGLCTDLFAFQSYTERDTISRQTDYLGVDLNKVWEPIHQEITHLSPGYHLNTAFYYDDIISIAERISVQVN